MTKWYVTVDKHSSYVDDPDAHVWTVSRDPDDIGWETDSGCPGYGLTKHDAEELANAANRVKMTEWQPIETAPKDGTNLLVTDGKTTELGWHDEFDAPDDPWCGYIKWPTHWMPLPEPPKQEAK